MKPACARRPAARPPAQLHHQWLALASAWLLLAGCSGGLKSNLPAAQIYLLRPNIAPAAATTGAAATGAAVGNVQVMQPQVSAGLASDRIVVLHSGERLDYYSAARWAAPTPAMLQMLVIDTLRASNRFAMVETDAGPFPAEYLLSMELRHFEAEYTGSAPPTVHVTLDANLGRRGRRDAIVGCSADSQVKAESDRMQAVVAAFEQATGQALAQLAACIAPHAAPP
jgi:cholesterol transport system auxiliary component